MTAHLGDDFEPDVDVDGAEALLHCDADLFSFAVLEPDRQEPKRILQSVTGRQGDRAEEGCTVVNVS